VLGKPSVASQSLVRQYVEFQQTTADKGDESRGREIYVKHCAACHVSDAEGRAAGPNLTNLSDRSPKALTESILAPNASVEPRYQGHTVLTLDGRAFAGTISDESGDSITLMQANGQAIAVRRSEVEDLSNTGMSLMPEGFQQELDFEELRDLVTYLRSDSFLQSAGTP
jgi:putative heme-binding domain-containing protein